MSPPDHDALLDLEQRLTDMEIRITHQEATLETLNDVIVRQQQMIDSLSDALKSTRRRLNELDSASDIPAQSEPPPPHY